MANAGNAAAMSPTEFETALLELIGETWWRDEAAIVRYIQDDPQCEGMKVFSLEHCYFANHFPRWFGNIVGNCPLLGPRQYMIENMFVEEVKDPAIDAGHYESTVDFAVAMGATRDEVYNYRPSITQIMAVAYWDRLSRNESWLEAFAGIGGLECQNNAKLAARYGQVPLNSKENFRKFATKESLDDKSMAHWEAATEADTGDEGHGQQTIDILVRHADTAEVQQAVLASMGESLRVFKFQYDLIGQWAFEADRRERGRA